MWLRRTRPCTAVDAAGEPKTNGQQFLSPKTLQYKNKAGKPTLNPHPHSWKGFCLLCVQYKSIKSYPAYTANSHRPKIHQLLQTILL